MGQRWDHRSPYHLSTLERFIHKCQSTSFFYEGSLSRKINLSQGTGQGGILAPFMYKVYVNGLLNVLSNHCYAIFINGLRIPSPSFADDISLFTLHPSFLKSFMNICNRYGINWRYDFNHSKSGIVW